MTAAPTTTGRPTVTRDRSELATALAAARAAGHRVGLVPTMGALHAGHAALLAAARADCDTLVCSIFVNPLQFGPGEDLARYPRTFDADLTLCGRHRVDLVFAPAAAVMYPDGPPRVSVSAGELGRRWEGAARPGHFDGVLTVVAKLCLLTRAELAVFGEKDAQQLALVRRLVADLELPVTVLAVPTVRDPDGLAVSSRNRYLGPEQRRTATALPRALAAGVAAAAAGPAAVLAAAREPLVGVPGLSVDYLDLVAERTFDRPTGPGPARLIGAVRVAGTRLIDNLPLLLGGDR